ncbi:MULTISPECIES: DUF697 domain-containing protein [unclassified Aureispira]|uniref:DUF697 domain-containing protein n=1 Tax=unclassified Aureispira TaxID=2649989 RepID=UPI00069755D0|nr:MULTISPECIES: DUF697 domain-containing protein [unclassified Aureispira]WMX17315.1 DUF697 domain-containing protein [Aureispira sp. CCB-E]
MSNKNNNEDLNQRAESAVRNHVIWSMGAGFIPIPIADFVAVAAVQLDMIRTISNIYGVDFKETEGKALVTSLTGSGLSRLGANALLKLVPGFGSVLGGVSMSIVSGASTYALGQVFKTHFSVGGTFLDFDTDRFQRYYDEQFEKGKTVAEDIQREKEEKGAVKEDTVEYTNTTPQKEASEENANSEIVRKLKELAELKDMGVIDDEEFAQMKARLIENYK